MNYRLITFENLKMCKPRFHHIVLFGPPGAGKGAQAEILSHEFHFIHLSTGDVIRDEIKKGTELGRRVQAAVERGEFADDQTVLEIILSRVDRPDFQNGFVMDGFPRNLYQARMLDRVLAERRKSLDCALFFLIPDEVILNRLTGREICSKCKATYHTQFKRPRIEGICDLCHGKVVRRHDDNPEAYQIRLQAYHQKTAPLAEYYEKAGILYNIDGDQPIDEVAQEIRTVVGEGC